jgi:hypothetical protein
MCVWQHSTGKILKTLSMPQNMSAGELLVTPAVQHIRRIHDAHSAYNRL